MSRKDIHTEWQPQASRRSLLSSEHHHLDWKLACAGKGKQIPWAAMPAPKPAEPGAKPAEPGTKPAEPGTKPAGTGAKPAEAGAKPAEAGTHALPAGLSPGGHVLGPPCWPTA